MADEIDPLVCYIIIRSSLKMTAGKTGVQIGHLVQHLICHYFKVMIVEAKIKGETVEHEHLTTTTAWLKNGSTKIAKSATEEEWMELKKESGKNLFIVKDAGKTEVAPGSETGGILYPMQKSKTSQLVANLPLL